MVSSDSELTDKLMHLESDLSMKKLEIQSLREQISQMKDRDSGPVSRTEINERIVEINSLRQELERTKKDKNITSGLVTQMQRDMTSKVHVSFIFCIKGQFDALKNRCCLKIECICIPNSLQNIFLSGHYN